MNRLLPCTVALGLLAAAGCAHVPLPTLAASHGYAVTRQLPIGGPGRWDLLAVDSARHHLFLSRSDHLDIVDTVSGQRIAGLEGTDGVHAIAIAASLNLGYSSNGGADSVTEFGLDSLQRVRDIKVSGHSPDAMVFDEPSQRLFVFNTRSNNASVIDPATGKEVATIAFQGNPELGVSDGKGHVFVNIEDKHQLVRIDAKTMAVTRTWDLTGCEEPTGLAIDLAHDRLFSACQNKTLVVTDARSGAAMARLAIGDGPDGVEFDPARQLVFVPGGASGTLSIIHEDDPDHFSLVQTLTTQVSARTIVLDAASHRLYLPAARFEPPLTDSKERPPMIPDSFTLIEVGDDSAR